MRLKNDILKQNLILKNKFRELLRLTVSEYTFKKIKKYL